MSKEDYYWVVIFIVLLIVIVILPLVLVAININEYWDNNPNIYN